MEAESSFWLIWLVYLSAAAIFYSIFWWATSFRKALWISCSLRAIAAAVIFTPWYASAQGETFAPALIVMLLDAITISGGAASRAAGPLVMAVIAAELLATLFYFVRKNSKKSEKTAK